jgi:hypothetical protein
MRRAENSVSRGTAPGTSDPSNQLASAGAGGISASTGKPRSCQPSKPPANGRMRMTPRLRKRSASLALVASLGQEQ